MKFTTITWTYNSKSFIFSSIFKVICQQYRIRAKSNNCKIVYLIAYFVLYLFCISLFFYYYFFFFVVYLFCISLFLSDVLSAVADWPWWLRKLPFISSCASLIASSVNRLTYQRIMARNQIHMYGNIEKWGNSYSQEIAGLKWNLTHAPGIIVCCVINPHTLGNKALVITGSAQR